MLEAPLGKLGTHNELKLGKKYNLKCVCVALLLQRVKSTFFKKFFHSAGAAPRLQGRYIIIIIIIFFKKRAFEPNSALFSQNYNFSLY